MEEKAKDPSFWEKKEEAVKISKETSDLKEEVGKWDYFQKEINELGELVESGDESLEKELEEKLLTLEEEINREEFKIFLSGKYDKGPAILSIYSGAGGQDAQDWASILLRMYQRYCEKKGFDAKIISHSFGDAGSEGRIGTKQVSLQVKGNYAYGFLKRESGVHRLVRMSPFSSQGLRHTSFALVEVLPEISIDEEAIEVNPEDLRMDFYRASGPGGQYVNKRESAVRITHLPSGIVVSCQSERIQGRNRETAMKMLYSKLYILKKQKEEKKMSKIKGGPVAIEWGSQIRNYVFHPYKLVKDLRTGVETSNVEAVLDGEIDQFIESEIRLKKND